MTFKATVTIIWTADPVLNLDKSYKSGTHSSPQSPEFRSLRRLDLRKAQHWGSYPRFFFSTFDYDQLTRIRHHHRKEPLKIRKGAKSKSGLLKTTKILLRESRNFTDVWLVGLKFLTSTIPAKFRKISRLRRAISSIASETHHGFKLKKLQLLILRRHNIKGPDPNKESNQL